MVASHSGATGDPGEIVKKTTSKTSPTMPLEFSPINYQPLLSLFSGWMDDHCLGI